MRTGRFIVSDDIRVDGNAFTFVRFILALAVVFSHCFSLTGNAAKDPSLKMLPFPISAFAVFLFFSLSGFLVTGGLLRKGVLTFAISRILRLLPGLAVMLMLTSLSIMLLFGSLSLSIYVNDLSLHRYIWHNLILIGRSFSIDGVFDHNPQRNVVNGSLWTIPWEVRCYVVLAVFSMLSLLASRSRLLVIVIVLIAVHLFFADIYDGLSLPPRRLALSFLLGVSLYRWHDRIYLSWPLALIAIVLAILIPILEVKVVLLIFSLTYLMLVGAILIPRWIKRASVAAPDYSYGLYIYAFPVQQEMIAAGVGLAPLSNMLASLPTTILLASASWHLIEKPALAWKGQLTTMWMRSKLI